MRKVIKLYNPEKDKSSFFVALSRAKKEIMFTFCEYRNSSKYPKQSHDQINEFFELLKKTVLASVVYESECTED